MLVGMKPCPYCAEDIKVAAIKCRYCGSELTQPEQARELAVPEQREAEPAPNASPSKDYLVGRYPVPRDLDAKLDRPEPEVDAEEVPWVLNSTPHDDRSKPVTDVAGTVSALVGDPRSTATSTWSDHWHNWKPLLLGAIILIAIVSAIDHRRSKRGKRNDAYVTASEPSRPSREDRIKRQFSSWDGAHLELQRYVKSVMNDPGSYEHVSTRYSDQGDHLMVTLAFRGKNAFGGVVKNFVMAHVDLDGNIIKITYEGE